ncbi:MAG: hypothetical protein KGH54_03490 [Candidatus Micrarchaeota archaeon]|nr:hypothetical protein [Candidatus Micrarchaeota archaeon]
MGSSKKSASASSAEEIETMLFGEGLERSFTSDELARAIREKRSASLVEQLKEYAGEFPQSRETIICAFDKYLMGSECARLARAVKKGLSEIVAINMVEALGVD